MACAQSLAPPVYSVPPDQVHYSTHDYSSTPTVNLPTGPEAIPVDVPEAWADVKTPGDGRTYSVGTINVFTTNRVADLVAFSHVDLAPAPFPAQQFQLATLGGVSGSKEVVVLQCCGADLVPSGSNPEQKIQWQVFWYGDSHLPNPGPHARKPTNARAISVWPVYGQDGAPNRLETRIAICGETYESTTGNNQFDGVSGWNKIDGNTSVLLPYPRGLPNGYIAVFNGEGMFLWSHQFFFQDPGSHAPEGASAITDVSIRVEPDPEGGFRDVVTYCGISAFGDHVSEDTALTPRLPFDAPMSIVPTYVPAGGDTDNGQGQWDGIVGRIHNLHTASPVGSATVKDFHSIVGGVVQDGLWGIAELTRDRFVVVGSTTKDFVGAIASGATFPFYVSPTDWNGTSEYSVGVVMAFDASPTRSGNNLTLEFSASLGHVGEGLHTHASDVMAHYAATQPTYSVVGTTDDPGLFASNFGWSLTPVVPMPAGGITNGFLVTANDIIPVNPVLNALSGSFQGNDGIGGWTGVAGWNEYVDHITVVGYAPSGSPNLQDLTFSSFFVDTPSPGGTGLLELLRSGSIATAPVERTAVMGEINANTPRPLPIGSNGLVYLTGLDYLPGIPFSPAGGGVAVDERGRMSVIGAASSAGFPVKGGAHARSYRGGQDAVRALVDMLPLGVGRADGSGIQVHSGQSIPSPLPGTTGRTTPTCALTPFGSQIGVAGLPGVVSLRRMFIDWEGPAPSATPNPQSLPSPPPIHWLLVDRPPADLQAIGTIVQFGIPTAPSSLGIGGLEDWVPSGVGISSQLFASSAPESVRIPLVLPPATGVTFSAQVVSWMLSTTFTCTGQGLSATPAIVFSY